MTYLLNKYFKDHIITIGDIEKHHETLLAYISDITKTPHEERTFIDGLSLYGLDDLYNTSIGSIKRIFIDRCEQYKCLSIMIDPSLVTSHKINPTFKNCVRMVQDIILLETLRKSLLEYYTWDYDGEKISTKILNSMFLASTKAPSILITEEWEIIRYLLVVAKHDNCNTFDSMRQTIKKFEPFFDICNSAVLELEINGSEIFADDKRYYEGMLHDLINSSLNGYHNEYT